MDPISVWHQASADAWSAVEWCSPSGSLAGLHWSRASTRPPILALHGWLDNAMSFAPLASQMDAYDWLAPDLPGHGLSPARQGAIFYHLVDYLYELRQAIPAQPPRILIGHSLGAGLACLWAALYPDEVEALVLIDALGPMSDSPNTFVANLKQALNQRLDLPEPRRYGRIEELIRLRSLAGLIERDSASLLMARNAELEADAQSVLLKTDPLLKVRSPMRLVESQVIEVLQAIRAPVLLIEAEDTLPLLKQQMEQRRQYLPQLEHCQLPGGHHLHMDQAHGVAQRIEQFLERACQFMQTTIDG